MHRTVITSFHSLHSFKFITILIFTLLFFKINLNAEQTINHAVLINISVDSSTSPKIILNWLPDTLAKSYTVYRKNKDEKVWHQKIKLDSTKNVWTDSDIVKEKGYEYFVRKKTFVHS